MINGNLFINYTLIIILLSIFTLNINKKFENIDKRFDSIDEKLDFLTGKKYKDISTISSCFIIVKDKNDKKYYGSGNLVNIDNNLFVATCLHNFYDNTTGMIYIPEIIQNKDRNLKFDKEKIIFDINSKYDLALIPITEEDNIKDKAAFISNRTLEGGEKLYGTNYYLGEYSFGECYVVSTNLGPSHLTTNCPGKRHYSGTGYFNTDGFLAAIHKSGLKYTNELSKEDANEPNIEDEISEENLNEFKRKIEFYDEGHPNEIKFYDESSADNKKIRNVDNFIKIATDKCATLPQYQRITCKAAYYDKYSVEDFYKNSYNDSTKTIKNYGDVKYYLERTFIKRRKKFLEDIFEDYDLYVSERARNPRSILVDAKYLINLYQKRKIDYLVN